MKKFFLILLLNINLLFLKASNYNNNNLIHTFTNDNFYQEISKYKSFNEEFYNDYYECYQNNLNIIYSLNLINHPAFLTTSSLKQSFTFNGGIFVNKSYYLKESYVPNNLVPLTLPKINRKGETMLLDKTALYYANQMFNDAKSKGMSLIVYSGYRSYVKQANIYMATLDKTYVAKPGFSEHQTGLAIDIATMESGLSSHFEYTNEFLYLKDNAHLFGFIMRYPKDKTHITKYPYEAWHFRFVGIDIATKIYEDNLTLEEYLYMYVEIL